MDEATLTQLLNSANSSSGGSSLFDINAIMQSLAPFMIGLTVVSIVITVLYLISVINKWRANKAIVDIKKLLIEMNERDKMRNMIPATPVTPEPPATPDTTANS